MNDTGLFKFCEPAVGFLKKRLAIGKTDDEASNQMKTQYTKVKTVSLTLFMTCSTTSNNEIKKVYLKRVLNLTS